MKILIDGRLYGFEHAGIGRYVENLVRELSKDKSLELVLFARKENRDQLTMQQFSNVTILEADIPHYSLSEQLLMPFILRQAKCDLVHFPHFNVPVFYQGKYVVTIHDLIKHTSRGAQTTTRQSWFYWLKYLGYKFVFNQAVKRAARILVPSRTVKQELMETYKIPDDKVVVTYEGVDKKFQISNFSREAGSRSAGQFQNSDEVLNKYKIKKPFIIYTGSLYPHKNVERLVEAVKCSNDLYHDSRKLSLVVVCARGVFWERFKKTVKELGTEEIVNLVGFVPDEELVVLYQEAEAFVFPSLSEGFGLPGLEAMACGTPVVCSDIPVFREVYGEATIYFDPDNPTDIAQKIRKVISDMKIRDQLRQKGLEQVKKYSWGKMAKETLAVYEVCFSIKEDHQEKER